jgi:hypothetical protein
MDNTKIKLILDQGINILNNLNTTKNEYLDPLCVYIMLSVNSYKPIGTKLSISDNKIYLSDVNIF